MERIKAALSFDPNLWRWPGSLTSSCGHTVFFFTSFCNVLSGLSFFARCYLVLQRQTQTQVNDQIYQPLATPSSEKLTQKLGHGPVNWNHLHPSSFLLKQHIGTNSCLAVNFRNIVAITVTGTYSCNVTPKKWKREIARLAQFLKRGPGPLYLNWPGMVLFPWHLQREYENCQGLVYFVGAPIA